MEHMQQFAVSLPKQRRTLAIERVEVLATMVRLASDPEDQELVAQARQYGRDLAVAEEDALRCGCDPQVVYSAMERGYAEGSRQVAELIEQAYEKFPEDRPDASDS